jgi:MraZ protein
LHDRDFLLQWKKVPLCGGKCHLPQRIGANCGKLREINVFQGASSLSLDAKGRFSMPTRHRDVLLATAAGALTIARHPHGCLMVFPRPEWEKFRERVAQVKVNAQWMKRIFLGHAMDVEMDATGRVLVSPELRAFARLTREVMLLGMGEYFELWDQAKYIEDEAKAMTQGVPEAFEDFSF